MGALSLMDRASRALWQSAAARKRAWYARGGSIRGMKRSWAAVTDTRFAHGVLLRYARAGKPYDPYWWA